MPLKTTWNPHVYEYERDEICPSAPVYVEVDGMTVVIGLYQNELQVDVIDRSKLSEGWGYGQRQLLVRMPNGEA